MAGPGWFKSNVMEGATRSGIPGRYRSDESRLPSHWGQSRSRAIADPLPAALADLGAEPFRYVRLCLRRLRYFVLFDETNPKSRVMAYRVPHVGLTIFAGIGLLIMPAAVRKKLLPTIATVGLITLFHALTIVSARFHIPDRTVVGDLGRRRLHSLGNRLPAV